MREKIQDKYIIASALSGDEEAFGKLYDKYINDIFRFILFRVKNHQEAEDLCADVFLKTWQYISSEKRVIDNFRALLYRIARNTVIDNYRKSGKEMILMEESQLESIVDVSINIEESTKFKDDFRVVSEAIKKLSVENQELILMKYVDDLNIEEISEISGKSKGAIRVALHRAIKELKKILKVIK